MRETLSEKIQRGARHLRAALRGSALDRQHDDEARFHIESEAAELMRVHGLSSAEAHRRALAAFGGMTQTREAYRDARGFPTLEAFTRDVSHATRTLRREWAFSFAVVAVLALGIGATTAAFALVDAVYLARLPVRDQDRLVLLRASDELNRSPHIPWEVQNQLHGPGSPFADVAAYRDFVIPIAARTGDQALHLTFAAVSGGFFRVLGAQATVGRLIRPDDDVGGAANVVVIGDRLWHREFNGDPGIIGRTLYFVGHSFRVIGVAPPEFDFPGGTEAWIAVAPAVAEAHAALGPTPGLMVARLKPGVTRVAAAAGLHTVLHVDSASGKYAATAQGLVLQARGVVEPYVDAVLGEDVRAGVMVLFAGVVLVLMIVCTNAAGLLLARGISRAPELALRRALGASRARLLMYLVTECLLLGLAGGMLGLVIATGLIHAAVALAPSDLSMLRTAHLDAGVLGFMVLVTAGSVIAFGLAPALSGTRSEGDNHVRVGVRAATRGSRAGLARRALVAAQVSLALVILCGAGVMSRTMYDLQHVPLGFDPSHLLFFRPDGFMPGGFIPRRMAQRFDAFKDRVVQEFPKTPGLGSVTTAFTLPFVGGRLATTFYTVDGRLPTTDAPAQPTLVEEGLDDYFHIMDIPLASGRGFTRHDDRNAPVVVVVNQTLAREAWPGQDPIGHRVRVVDDSIDRFWTVVGVAVDNHFNDLSGPTRPIIYSPARQQEWDDEWFVVRTTGDPTQAERLLSQAVKRIDPDFAVRQTATGPDLLRTRLARPRALAAVFDALAATAVLLAGLGLFAILSASVRERRREIAIRSALGATPRRLRSLVLGQTLIVASAGVACGTPFAFLAAHLLHTTVTDGGLSDAFGQAASHVESLNGLTVAMVGVVLVAAVMLATYGPLIRATNVDVRATLATE